MLPRRANDNALLPVPLHADGGVDASDARRLFPTVHDDGNRVRHFLPGEQQDFFAHQLARQKPLRLIDDLNLRGNTPGPPACATRWPGAIPPGRRRLRPPKPAGSSANSPVAPSSTRSKATATAPCRIRRSTLGQNQQHQRFRASGSSPPAPVFLAKRLVVESTTNSSRSRSSRAA